MGMVPGLLANPTSVRFLFLAQAPHPITQVPQDFPDPTLQECCHQLSHSHSSGRGQMQKAHLACLLTCKQPRHCSPAGLARAPNPLLPDKVLGAQTPMAGRTACLLQPNRH